MSNLNYKFKTRENLTNSSTSTETSRFFEIKSRNFSSLESTVQDYSYTVDLSRLLKHDEVPFFSSLFDSTPLSCTSPPKLIGWSEETPSTLRVSQEYQVCVGRRFILRGQSTPHSSLTETVPGTVRKRKNQRTRIFLNEFLLVRDGRMETKWYTTKQQWTPEIKVGNPKESYVNTT